MKYARTLWAVLAACVAQGAPANSLTNPASKPVTANIVTKAAPAEAVVRERRHGTVGKVDAASHTVVVDGVAYSYATGTAFVHGGGRAVHSHHAPAVTLAPGMAIEFASRLDSGAARPRITEIWLPAKEGE